jgi:myo-inositol 2-dehydrogenase/D-chiro-inositol 1-dehydrogenase
MSNAQTRVALAGFGAWAQMHARAIENIDGATVTAVFCHSEKSAAAAAEIVPQAKRYSNYNAMLDAGDFDVVNVTVPNNLHASFAVDAMKAGAHVFLEKPLGISLADCDAVIATSQETNRLVALNHELRVSRQWGLVRDIVGDGDIGDVRYQHLSLFRHQFRQGSGGWRYDADRVGSWILEELVHFFDLVLWYGAENGRPKSVRAFGNGSKGGLTDNFTTILEWPNGSVAVLSQCLSGFEHHTLLELAATDGAIRTWWSGAMDRTLHPDFEFKVRRGAADAEEVSIPQSGEVFELEENLRRAYEAFHKGTTILSAEQARLSVEVCFAAEESYRSGSPVELPDG